jgi:hypothetical protein
MVRKGRGGGMAYRRAVFSFEQFERRTNGRTNEWRGTFQLRQNAFDTSVY